MPIELVTVAEIAKEFIVKSGYSFARLEKADLDISSGQWRLIFDVGVTTVIKKTVVVDNSTGKVVGFE